MKKKCLKKQYNEIKKATKEISDIHTRWSDFDDSFISIHSKLQHLENLINNRSFIGTKDQTFKIAPEEDSNLEAPMIDSRSIPQQQSAVLITMLSDHIKGLSKFYFDWKESLPTLESIRKDLKCTTKYVKEILPDMLWQSKAPEETKRTLEAQSNFLEGIKEEILDIKEYTGRENATVKIIHDNLNDLRTYIPEFNSALHATILSLIKRVKDLESITWYNATGSTIPDSQTGSLFSEEELQEMEQELPLSRVDQQIKDHADQYLREQEEKKEVQDPEQEKRIPKKLHIEMICPQCNRVTTFIEVGSNMHCMDCGTIGISVDQIKRDLAEKEKESIQQESPS